MVSPNNASSRPRYQFGFVAIAYAFVLLAVAAALHPEFLIPTTIVLAAWAIAFSFDRRLQVAAIGVVLLMVLFVFLTPQVAQIGDVARFSQCSSNVRQITLAALNYEAANGGLPRNGASPEGTGIQHSWRVLVEPYLAGGSLPPLDYRFDEEWDSPHNIKLLDRMPPEFQCPCHKSGFKTPYKLVTGVGTLSDPTSDQVIAGRWSGEPSNAIFLIEDSANLVEWTRPDGLTVKQALQLMNQMTQQQCSHIDDQPLWREFIGNTYSLLDGSVHHRGIQCEYDIPREAFTITNGFELDHNTNVQREQKFYAWILWPALMTLSLLPTLSLIAKNKNVSAEKNSTSSNT